MSSTTPDYSNSPLTPTPISWIIDGTGFRTTISNTVGGSDTKDYVTFTIPAGQSLTSFELSSYSSPDGVAFIALQPGTSVTGSDSNTTPFSGYSHFGNSSSVKVGSSLMTLLGSSVQSTSYSAWIQQLGASTDYSFTLKTAPVTDTTPPSIVISVNKTSLKAGDTAQITFALSDPATDFIQSDITVTGGTLSNFSGSGSSYAAVFTPFENRTTPGSASVSSFKFSDAAGNQNVDGAETNNAVSMAIDTVVPTIALSSNKTSLQAGETATVTFTLSEPATDFVAADVTVIGGLLSNFAGSGASYTGTFTPVANGTTAGAISVASNMFSDSAGNRNVDGADANNAVSIGQDDYQGDEISRGTAGPDVLDGGGSDNRILLGFDGNDLGRGLYEGDVFIGGQGTDTAQMTGNAADFVIRLASPSQRSVLRDLSPDSYSDFSPVFAIQAKSSVTGITLVQSELIQFGEAAAVDPMSLVAGGLGLVVNSKVAGALPSISAAIAQATDGAAIFVSAIHQDPSGSAPIIVTRDNLRIVLENAEAPGFVFQLAENSGVRDLSVFGRGSADLIGNSFNNRLVGNDGPNSIDGRGGNDQLFGAGGEDHLFGGTSSDWLDGGDGFDRLFGGSGNDTLVSDERAINAGGDRDQTNAGDLLVGGSGDDVLIAGNSAAGSAPVRMMGGSGADAFRLINSNGLGSTATDPAELSPSNLKVFIADLTQADGLDLSAFRTAASGGGALTQLPVGTAALGDYTIPLSGLYAVGLLGLAEGTGMTRPSAPTDQVAVASALTIAMASTADIQSAAARALSLPSTQALADQILPQLYAPFAEFLNQIYVQY